MRVAADTHWTAGRLALQARRRAAWPRRGPSPQVEPSSRQSLSGVLPRRYQSVGLSHTVWQTRHFGPMASPFDRMDECRDFNRYCKCRGHRGNSRRLAPQIHAILKTGTVIAGRPILTQVFCTYSRQYGQALNTPLVAANAWRLSSGNSAAGSIR